MALNALGGSKMLLFFSYNSGILSNIYATFIPRRDRIPVKILFIYRIFHLPIKLGTPEAAKRNYARSVNFLFAAKIPRPPSINTERAAVLMNVN